MAYATPAVSPLRRRIIDDMTLRPLSKCPRLLENKGQNLIPGKLFTKHNRPVLARAAQLENALCQANAHDGDFRHGCPLLL